MKTLKIRHTRQMVLEDGRHRTSTQFMFGRDGRSIPVFFETGPEVPFLTGNLGDLWIAPALLVAMRNSMELKLDDPISNGRVDDFEAIQDVLTTWYPDRMTRVPVTAPGGLPVPSQAPGGDERAVGACFTAGVDAFHTLVKNRGQVGALLYGVGLDVPTREEEFAARVHQLLKRVSEETGIRLLTARTNVRRVLGLSRVSWGYEGHGAALAALGTVFAPLISHLLVPSTHTYLDPQPWGSSPMLDHRWSTERLSVVYDGGEASRVLKTQRIARESVVQRYLRVCYRQFDTLNCGLCAKCLRTMTTLEVVGNLSEFATFDEPLDLKRVAAFELQEEREAVRIREVREFAEDVGRDDVAAALTAMLDRFDASRAS